MFNTFCPFWNCVHDRFFIPLRRINLVIIVNIYLKYHMSETMLFIHWRLILVLLVTLEIYKYFQTNSLFAKT